jgi:hypothetical protein
MVIWDGSERRGLVDRRRGERRAKIRNGKYSLIMLDNVTWVDISGSDRRMRIRRLQDRRWLASRIIDCFAQD